jgi:hypothetical protein
VADVRIYLERALAGEDSRSRSCAPGRQRDLPADRRFALGATEEETAVSQRTHYHLAEMDAFDSSGDPVADLLIAGRAETIEQAEEIYLNENLDTLLALVDSQLSDEEFRRHPLVQLLLSRGSRPWEDSTT